MKHNICSSQSESAKEKGRAAIITSGDAFTDRSITVDGIRLMFTPLRVNRARIGGIREGQLDRGRGGDRQEKNKDGCVD